MSYDKSTFYGLDPQYSRQGAQHMRSGAEQVGGMVDQVSRLLEQVTWMGPDSQRFLSDWNGQLRPQLARATDELHTNADELTRRAQMQEDASS